MESKKDNQRETMIMEIIAWVFLFGIIYMLSRGGF